MSRTITFRMDRTSPAGVVDAVAGLLLSLPPAAPSAPGQKGNSIAFDEATRLVCVWRLGNVWTVSFRPAGDGTLGHYRSPVDAARAVVEGRHNEHSVEAADTGCAGLVPAPGNHAAAQVPTR
jgi:hypothetical protein